MRVGMAYLISAVFAILLVILLGVSGVAEDQFVLGLVQFGLICFIFAFEVLTKDDS